MIRFEVYEQDTGRLCRSFTCHSGLFGDGLYMAIYEYLIRVFEISQSEADEAASWCELADVGSWYAGDGFEICCSFE